MTPVFSAKSDASATRRFCRPRRRNCGSTTAPSSSVAPMRQLPAGWITRARGPTRVLAEFCITLDVRAGEDFPRDPGFQRRLPRDLTHGAAGLIIELEGGAQDEFARVAGHVTVAVEGPGDGRGKSSSRRAILTSEVRIRRFRKRFRNLRDTLDRLPGLAIISAQGWRCAARNGNCRAGSVRHRGGETGQRSQEPVHRLRTILQFGAAGVYSAVRANDHGFTGGQSMSDPTWHLRVRCWRVVYVTFPPENCQAGGGWVFLWRVRKREVS